MRIVPPSRPFGRLPFESRQQELWRKTQITASSPLALQAATKSATNLGGNPSFPGPYNLRQGPQLGVGAKHQITRRPGRSSAVFAGCGPVNALQSCLRLQRWRPQPWPISSGFTRSRAEACPGLWVEHPIGLSPPTLAPITPHLPKKTPPPPGPPPPPPPPTRSISAPQAEQLGPINQQFLRPQTVSCVF